MAPLHRTLSTIAALIALLACSFPAKAIAQSFAEQVTGIYTSGDGFDVPVRMVIHETEGGFAGSVVISGARYALFAEQDGPRLRGVFDMDGQIQRFSFPPPKGSIAAVRFAQEPEPVEMSRQALPNFAGHYSGPFGGLTIEHRQGRIIAAFRDTTGVVTTGEGRSDGLRLTAAALSASVFFDPEDGLYYLELPGYFGQVAREEAAVRVGASEDAAFKSLAQALVAVSEGAVIELMPGTYSGPFEVGKPVTIRGSGSPGDVVLTADSDVVIEWPASGGTLENLSIEVPAQGVGVSTFDGSLNIVRTVFRVEDEGAGVFASGVGKVTVTDSTFDGGAHSVFAQDFSGELTITGSALGNTSKSVVSVLSGGTEGAIVIEDSKFSGSPSNALRLENVGAFRATGNTIRDVRVGLLLIGSNSTTLVGNVLTDISTHGLWFKGDQGKSLLVQDTELEGIGEACLLFDGVVVPEAGVVLSGSQVRGCGRFGLAVAGTNSVSAGESGIRLTDSRFEANQSHIALYAPVALSVEQSQFEGAQAAAILLSDNSRFEMSGSSIENSAEQGLVAIGSDVELVLDNTRIAGSGQSGVVLSGTVTAWLNGFTVQDSRGHGIELHPGVDVARLDGATIIGNEGAGLYALNESLPDLAGNRIENNLGGAVLRR